MQRLDNLIVQRSIPEQRVPVLPLCGQLSQKAAEIPSKQFAASFSLQKILFPLRAPEGTGTYQPSAQMSALQQHCMYRLHFL